jgi:hypothetical protein
MSRFELGRVVATPSALEVLSQQGVSPAELLARHVSGDWGEVCAEDAEMNERSVRNGWRILSVYETNPRGVSRKVWLLTEADRSSTCLLLPNEY